ncbi:MAG TPA: PilZ domain-containing protein [Candidatus Acidoferrum sp.]|nr:PilZ domain-containing protein [Candidatus Acidoferrum sp.]
MKPQPHGKPAGAQRVVATRPPTAEERRRAQRVLLRIRVLVQVAGNPNSLESSTHTVSASGGMLIVPEPLSEGTKVTLENPKTQAKVEARVVRPPQMTHEGALVPVEFSAPSPNFWGIFFPPILN